ncbi:hypothetical protein HDU82_005170 [Entophlyctis luteolus]|nr:hypothetical protein HDU82_005170 [Entophlyctis luteolus]
MTAACVSASPARPAHSAHPDSFMAPTPTLKLSCVNNRLHHSHGDSHCISNTSPQSSATSSSSRVKIVMPPALLALVSKAESQISANPSSPLYHSFSTHDKARLAVIYAYANSPHEFLFGRFQPLGIVGFGANGAVISAIDMTQNCLVAVKIIYKHQRQSSGNQTFPSEIEALVAVNCALPDSCRVLRCLGVWQDAHHFYLVTQLFGSDWLTPMSSDENCSKSNEDEDATVSPPLVFKTISQQQQRRLKPSDNDVVQLHRLPFSAGASDLWAWSVMHRRVASAGASSPPLLPTNTVRHVFRECAAALADVHAAGFCHGDIKLENFLVQQADDGNPANARVVLADFGQAFSVAPDLRERTGTASRIRRYGTMEMSAPEFLYESLKPLIHDLDYDPRSADVFALGMVLFVLLSQCGDLPVVVTAKEYPENLDQYDCVRQSKEFPFDGIEEWDPLAADLLTRMCYLDPNRRLRISEVLEHGWFRV